MYIKMIDYMNLSSKLDMLINSYKALSVRFTNSQVQFDNFNVNNSWILCNVNLENGSAIQTTPDIDAVRSLFHHVLISCENQVCNLCLYFVEDDHFQQYIHKEVIITYAFILRKRIICCY